MREVVPDIWCSPLPKVGDVASFVEMGGRSIVDLTRRPRRTLERECRNHGLRYTKVPLSTAAGEGDFEHAARVVTDAPRPVLFHCYHGVDRTTAVAWRVRRMCGAIDDFAVVLYRFDKNILRVIRTCATFGVRRVLLVESPVVQRKPPYAAEDRVTVSYRATWADVPRPAIGMSPRAKVPLSRAPWPDARALVLGGVHDNPPVRQCNMMARVDGSRRPELMTKDAVAIGLFCRALTLDARLRLPR